MVGGLSTPPRSILTVRTVSSDNQNVFLAGFFTPPSPTRLAARSGPAVKGAGVKPRTRDLARGGLSFVWKNMDVTYVSRSSLRRGLSFVTYLINQN